MKLISLFLKNAITILVLVRLAFVSKANSENIKKTISSFNWNKAFENLSSDYTKLYEISIKIIFPKKKKKKLSATTVSIHGWMVT